MKIAGALATAVSGLRFNGERASAAADNIANINTPNRKAASIRASSLVVKQVGGSYAPGGVRTSVRYGGEIDLTREFTRLMESKIGYGANAKVIKAVDETLGRLIDLKA